MLLVQGVRNVYDTNESRGNSESAGQDEAKLVLIGRGVDQDAFKESLIALLGSS